MTPSFEALFLNDTPLMDVRAPVEFSRGAFPNSKNLPLLNDKQRHEIGVCYKNHGQEKAIELGYKIFTPDKQQDRITTWQAFIDQHPEGYLYCFRGGLRSKITQQWLADAGTKYPMVQGGYKLMRTYLIEQLEGNSTQLPFLILGGKTGSGKTKVLKKLSHHIDLEGLARHRGSSFGGLLQPQPSNIDFENALSIEMLRHKVQQPARVFLEDEGKLIGRVCIPLTLRTRMLSLPVVELIETLDHRISVAEEDYIKDLLSIYQHHFGEEYGVEKFADHHYTALNKIKKRFGDQRLRHTQNQFKEGLRNFAIDGSTRHFHDYIKSLLIDYYDPMYDYQFKRKNRVIVFKGNTDAVIDWASSTELTQ